MSWAKFQPSSPSRRYSPEENSQGLAHGCQKGAGAVSLKLAPRQATAAPSLQGKRDQPVASTPGSERVLSALLDAESFCDAARQGRRINNLRVLKGAARCVYCTVKTLKLAGRLYGYLYRRIFYTRIQTVLSSLPKFWARCWTEGLKYPGLMGGAVGVKKWSTTSRYLAHASLFRSC